MCEEYAGPGGHYNDLGIKQLRLPTVDHFEPSLEYMQVGIYLYILYLMSGVLYLI